MLNKKNIQILETTLRDGSYPIHFRFTAKETSLICEALEKAGFRLIEVGHGLGLNASNCGYGAAAEDDETYMKAANSVLKKAKYGMFFIPGIGRLEDIKLAAKHNMGFIRVGTNVTEVEKAEKAIKLAKSLGMIVSSNLMKSYVLPPKKLVEKAKKVESYGADIIVLVDSAGGMTPNIVKEYITLMRKELHTKLGFHGHNNLQLALANSLTALENGVEIIDTSLLGIGRSAGNTPTEIFLLVLKKMGYDLGIDINATLDLGYKFIAPYLVNIERLKPLHAIAGYAEFHSSFMKKVFLAAKKWNLNPRDIILEVSKIEKVNVTEQLLDQVSRKLNQIHKRTRVFRLEASKQILSQDKIAFSIQEDLDRIISDMQNISSKLGKTKVFTITLTSEPHDPTIILPFTIESDQFVIGSAEVFSKSQISYILPKIDGKVDFILVDATNKETRIDVYKEVKSLVQRSALKFFNGDRVLISAGDAFVTQLSPGRSRVLVIGGNNIAKGLTLLLAEKGYDVYYFIGDGSEDIVRSMNTLVDGPERITIVKGETQLKDILEDIDIIVGCTRHKSTFPLRVFKSNSYILDLGIGSFDSDTIKSALRKGVPFYRVDTRSALIGDCLLYTSDAADEGLGVDLGGRRVFKKKNI